MAGKRLMQYQHFHCFLYRSVYDRFRSNYWFCGGDQTMGWCTMMFYKNAFCLRLLKLCGRGNDTVVMHWRVRNTNTCFKLVSIKKISILHIGLRPYIKIEISSRSFFSTNGTPCCIDIIRRSQHPDYSFVLCV
jgi:hypothetical protein